MKQQLKFWAKASLAVLSAAAFSLAPALTQAQDYPTKPVRIITPFPVGSGPEGVVRLLANKLSIKWGQSVIDGALFTRLVYRGV